MDEYMAALDIIAKTNHIPEAGAAEIQQPLAKPKANNMTNNENEEDALEWHAFQDLLSSQFKSLLFL